MVSPLWVGFSSHLHWGICTASQPVWKGLNFTQKRFSRERKRVLVRASLGLGEGGGRGPLLVACMGGPISCCLPRAPIVLNPALGASWKIFTGAQNGLAPALCCYFPKPIHLAMPLTCPTFRTFSITYHLFPYSIFYQTYLTNWVTNRSHYNISKMSAAVQKSDYRNSITVFFIAFSKVVTAGLILFFFVRTQS